MNSWVTIAARSFGPKEFWAPIMSQLPPTDLGNFFISFILDYGKLLRCLKLMKELKWLKGFCIKNQKNTEEQTTIYIASSNHYWSLKQVFRVEGFSINYISCREVARKIGT